ncbi:MAG: RadC family protein [Clostridia bacterium]|nr:RadC family protein [Clostridia bacterium]
MTMHEGHRHRMRERFLREGLSGFADHEVLELMLFYCKPRGNVNPLAHELLEKFGSLKGVLEARGDKLMTVKGVGEETAVFLTALLPMMRRYQECVCRENSHFASHGAMEAYCRAMMAGLRSERFCVISLSSTMDVLGQRVITEGSLTEVMTYPRLIIEAALDHNAHSLVLCHNHPGGEPAPSPQDIETTRNLQVLLYAVGVLLLDHVIVAGESSYSCLMHGDIPPITELVRERTGKKVMQDVEALWLNERIY